MRPNPNRLENVDSDGREEGGPKGRKNGFFRDKKTFPSFDGNV